MNNWQTILRTNFIHLDSLIDFLEIDEENKKKIKWDSQFRLNLPRRLASKINKNDLNDPIFKQFVPLIDEDFQAEHFLIDPVSDCSFKQSSKLLKKYANRALIISTSACAMHCRYCFRRNFDYDCSDKSFSDELELVKNDPSIDEIILSGGDPLSLSNRSLNELLTRLSLIPHIKRVRFHSRFPIGIPERIDDEFLTILQSSKPRIWFVTHINHPNECDPDIFESFFKLQKLGIPVLNQAVLLKDINDDVFTLKELSENLVNHGILPYYLHQLDRVQGTSHFEVSKDKGKELIKELTSLVSGYAVPKYVEEIPFKKSKTAIS